MKIKEFEINFENNIMTIYLKMKTPKPYLEFGGKSKLN